MSFIQSVIIHRPDTTSHNLDIMAFTEVFSSSLLFIFLCIKKSNFFCHLNVKSRSKVDFRVDSNNATKDLVSLSLQSESSLVSFALRLHMVGAWWLQPLSSWLRSGAAAPSSLPRIAPYQEERRVSSCSSYKRA